MRPVDEEKCFQPRLGLEPKIMQKTAEDSAAALSVQGEHHFLEDSVRIEIPMLGQALRHGAKATRHELFFRI